MKSIRSKFLALNLISILLCAGIIGGAGIWTVAKSQTVSSDRIMHLTCVEEGEQLNRDLFDVKRSVTIFSEAAVEMLGSIETLREDGGEYLSEMRSLMDNIARGTSAASYYLRLAPEVGGAEEGFLCVRQRGQVAFSRVPMTDPALYDPGDLGHVGWYYLPVEAGQAVWMEPYFNENLGLRMITYTAPLYCDGVFFGVTGMDIDFETMVESVREIRPYSTGYAFLSSPDGRIHYHPELPAGTRLTESVPELASLVEAFSLPGADQAEFSYHYQNMSKKLAFMTLSNGAKLVLTAEKREINAPQRKLLLFISLVTAAVAGLAVLPVLSVSDRITRPLNALTRAANQIAAGNMCVDLPPPGDDEVGTLSRTFATTAAFLRDYMEGMNDLAYMDPLTGVKNKAAYNMAMEQLKVKAQLGVANYALMMLDVNNLKKINDQLGHDRGNDYLVNNCQLIRSIFQHSPIYRIGGDEFVVVLEGRDRRNCQDLSAEMDRRAAESQKEAEPWKRISIARGVSFYHAGDSAEEVFRRADQAMYENKRQMKGLDKPRDAKNAASGGT